MEVFPLTPPRLPPPPRTGPRVWRTPQFPDHRGSLPSNRPWPTGSTVARCVRRL
ncbi:BnaUnng02500D [Brassica napus]|uniref:BnaUnng02500D protein n=1 Tax=Brassica napus TaxID=3708 RepID=A0A078JQR7_BRANA|nr:BnaUnng02500D [Brassica napus]